jgi:predicted nucleic acid-binding protein
LDLYARLDSFGRNRLYTPSLQKDLSLLHENRSTTCSYNIMAGMTEQRAAFHSSIVRDILAQPGETEYLDHFYGSSYSTTSPTSPFDHYTRPFGSMRLNVDPFRFDVSDPALSVADAAAVVDSTETLAFSFEHRVPRNARPRMTNHGIGPVLRRTDGGTSLLASSEMPGVPQERISLDLVGTRVLKLAVEWTEGVPPAISMVRLSRDVEASDIEASYVDGVLRVTLAEGASSSQGQLLDATVALKADQEARLARVSDLEDALRTARREAHEAQVALCQALADERRAVEQRHVAITIGAARKTKSEASASASEADAGPTAVMLESYTTDTAEVIAGAEAYFYVDADASGLGAEDASAADAGNFGDMEPGAAVAHVEKD